MMIILFCIYDFVKACLKVHPSFQRLQPYAVFPLIIVPLPQMGHGLPNMVSSILRLVASAVVSGLFFFIDGFSVFFLGVTVRFTFFFISSSLMMVTWRLLLSLRTWLTISFI